MTQGNQDKMPHIIMIARTIYSFVNTQKSYGFVKAKGFIIFL